MAAKGDRERLEPVARQMFVDGKTLTAIEEILDVSRQTLDVWKNRGGWEKSKAAKDNYEGQLLQVRDEIVEKIAEAPLQASSYIDTLSKLDAILDRRAKAAREANEAIARQRGEMFLGVIQDLIVFAREHATDLAFAIDENFDALIQFGKEKYAA